MGLDEFNRWIEKELRKISNENDLYDFDKNLDFGDFKHDQFYFSLFKMNQEELETDAHNIAKQLYYTENKQPEAINDEIYSVLANMDKMINAVQNGNLGGVIEGYKSSVTHLNNIQDESKTYKADLDILNQIIRFKEDVKTLLKVVKGAFSL